MKSPKQRGKPERRTAKRRHPLVQEAIRELHTRFSEFVSAIEMGEPPDPDTLEILASKLQAWLKGEDARTLFPKLSGGGPVPKPRIAARNQWLAELVAQKIVKGETEFEAIEQVAEERRIKSSTVKSAFNKYRLQAKVAVEKKFLIDRARQE